MKLPLIIMVGKTVNQSFRPLSKFVHRTVEHLESRHKSFFATL